jgi:isochorismate synthase
LAEIDAGALEKVVLARPIEVVGAAVDPVGVLARARAAVPSCTTFLCRGRDGAAFVGSTPEKLCRIEGRSLTTHALASSAAVDRTGSLGEDDKDRREHRAVVDGIQGSLAPLCEAVEVASAPETVRLSYISHLRTPVHATLRPKVSAVEAVLALHPTAAVGGTPREPARRFLAEQEGFDRGWYAGAVGWIGPRGVDLRVGLRSALLTPGRATVYVGAGIVRGSTAEGEWRETRMKSRLMLAALGAWREP